jgi:hypothetical protein
MDNVTSEGGVGSLDGCDQRDRICFEFLGAGVKESGV